MSSQSETPIVHFDAYTGPEMAKRALASGEAKAKLPFLTTLLLGLLAGAYVALAGVFYTIVITDNSFGYGVTRLLGGLAFSLGLILVVVGGAELFTGNTLIFMGWLSSRVRTGRLLRNWAIVYLGNLLGSLMIVGMVSQTNHFSLNSYMVGATAVKIALTKVHLPWASVFFSAILCNALVCLAVWLCYSARTTTDRIMAIIFPITAFVAAGFEHCVANMYFIPLGIIAALDPNVVAAFGKPVEGLSVETFVVNNLIPATLGNIVGGSLIIGAVYWVAYLLPEHRRARCAQNPEECE
ncbi:MAG TPA: formate/nitrite transporter family protein [Armatimonadota bacterium]|jgi:formate/nitrite transporter